MSTKQTPKSCSCNACKRGKASTKGGWSLKYDERAYRHNAKIDLAKGRDVRSAPTGGYYD